jgi:hypothetical protein
MKIRYGLLSSAIAIAFSLSITVSMVPAQSRLETFGDGVYIPDNTASVRLSDEHSVLSSSLRFSDESNNNVSDSACQTIENPTFGNNQTLGLVRESLGDEGENPKSISSSGANLFWSDSIYHFPVKRAVPKLSAVASIHQAETPQFERANKEQFLESDRNLPSVSLSHPNMLKPMVDEPSSASKPLASGFVVPPTLSRSNPLKPIPASTAQEVEKSADVMDSRENDLMQSVSARWRIQDPIANQDGDDEPGLLKSFPVADLNAGIPSGSFKRACDHRVVKDPNYQFLTSAYQAPHHWGSGYVTYKTWESPNVYYRPLLFEEENLERYGQHAGYYLQPYVSGLHFFGGVVALPYRLASEGTLDCEYGMGYYRPGNCNPAYRKRINCSGRGLILQTATVGAILAL